MQVVIDVQGSQQFSVNNQRPLGRTAARRIMLEARGLQVLSIPYFEWALYNSINQQKAYLSRLMSSVLSVNFSSASAIPASMAVTPLPQASHVSLLPGITYAIPDADP